MGKENKKGRELMLSAPVFRQQKEKEQLSIKDVYAKADPVQKETKPKKSRKKADEVTEHEPGS